MPNWNESEYVKHAQEIASQHATTKKSLNDLTEKFARDNNMNPDEIRTIVRLANVATFQELFRQRDNGDKMVEFETGDPEAVIRRIVDSAANEPQSANIFNDRMAEELPDQMGAKRRGFEFPAQEEEKVAAEDSVPGGRIDLVVMNLRKLAEEFEIERLMAGQRWEQNLMQVAREFRHVGAMNFVEFEKDAFAELGEDVRPELTVIAEDLRREDVLIPSEKVAVLQERHLVLKETYALKLVKEAVAARHDYEKFKGGLEWVENNMPDLGR